MLKIFALKSGEFQVVELSASSTPFMNQIETSGMSIQCMDLSGTRHSVAFGDSGGGLHLISDQTQPTFNEVSRPTEFADPVRAYFIL